jgi:hypothetical protein
MRPPLAPVCLANLAVQQAQFDLADRSLHEGRYRPSVLVGLELVGRNSQALTQSQSLE